MPKKLSRLFWGIISCLLVMLNSAYSQVNLTDPVERVRRFTRNIEFDYITWTFDAMALKNSENLLGLANLIPPGTATNLVLEYADAIRLKQEYSSIIIQILSDPNIKDPAGTAAPYQEKLSEIKDRLDQISPTAESILQVQTSTVISKLGLSLAGQLIPSLAYHATPLPYALIVSPRNVIRQDANISLITDLSITQMIELEESVSKNLDVSTLVEEVGGIGTYPTMVQQSADINWICEVIAHEWIHNYLTLRPLGLNYETNSELRTMNETTASIAGKEIGALVIATYYPSLAPLPAPENPQPATPENLPEETNAEEPSEPVFSFRETMHTTRVTVDRLLQEDKVAEAEEYMEQQRKYLWENGYQIRKLNQAYFAFHGAYADTPGGAAGSDPVGPAVRQLREQAGSLASFIKKISWMTSFDQLQTVVNAK